MTVGTAQIENPSPIRRAKEASRSCNFNRSTNGDATVLCLLCAARAVREAVIAARAEGKAEGVRDGIYAAADLVLRQPFMSDFALSHDHAAMRMANKIYALAARPVERAPVVARDIRALAPRPAELRSLSDEELAKVKLPTAEEIAQAVTKGQEERRAFMEGRPAEATASEPITPLHFLQEATTALLGDVLNVDASMKERADAAEQFCIRFGLQWPPFPDAVEEEDDEEESSVDGRGVPAEVHASGWQWRPTSDDTAFAPPFSTVRACVDCGCLTAGGPSRCGRCAKDILDASSPVVLDNCHGPKDGDPPPAVYVDLDGKTVLDLDELERLITVAKPVPYGAHYDELTNALRAGKTLADAAPELIRRARRAFHLPQESFAASECTCGPSPTFCYRHARIGRAELLQCDRERPQLIDRADSAEREVSRVTADMDAMEVRHAESVEAVRKRAEKAERERDGWQRGAQSADRARKTTYLERDEARAAETEAYRETKAIRAERDDLAEALRQVAGYVDTYGTEWSHGTKAAAIARAALEKVSGK